MPKLDEELLSFLKSNGTSLAAFADLSKIDSAAREGFPIGISIAIALDPRIMSGIKAGPTAAYVGECQRADNLLDVLGQATARFLEQKGHKAKPRTKPGAENPDILSTKLPQKTVARRIAEPYFLVIKRVHLPTQPTPARVATVFWGSLVDRISGFSAPGLVR